MRSFSVGGGFIYSECTGKTQKLGLGLPWHGFSLWSVISKKRFSRLGCRSELDEF